MSHDHDRTKQCCNHATTNEEDTKCRDIYCEFSNFAPQGHSNPIFAMEYVTVFRMFLSRSARFPIIVTISSSACDHASSTDKTEKDTKCRVIFHREDGLLGAKLEKSQYIPS